MLKPQQLIDESAKYKHALDESSIVAITDTKGVILYANDNFCKISNYIRQELIGQDHRLINSGYHPKEFIRDLWTTIANGKTWRGDLKNKTKDGKFYWVETTIIPFLNDQGKPYQYLSIRSDITDRKRAEEQLRESEEKYRLLFNSMDEGYCVIEMIFNEHKKPIDYRFLEINASFESQTGLYNAVGKRMREFAPNHEEYWFEIYGKIALTGEPIQFKNHAEQLNRWYDVYAYRFGDPKDLQVAVLFKDITEHIKNEKQLLAVNKELEAFSYSVSHDLRAPLRAIDGYAKILEEDYGKAFDEEGKNVLFAIMENAQKMGHLIDDLLNFSRVGKKELTKANLNMNELVEAALNELNKYTTHKAKIKIAKLHPSLGDYRLINQVVVNLLSNAIKYSAKVAEPLIEISSERCTDKIIYTIKDNGAGFDMRYVDKLFGVFQRLHTVSEFEGTGIGLAIVQRIVTRLGGKVWAEGGINKGATFKFSLPSVTNII